MNSTTTADGTDAESRRTTVEVRCTGHVRDTVGEHSMPFTFEGSTLRELLEAFFGEYDVEDLLIAETDRDASTDGWARAPDPLPGTWRSNPPGERTQAYARVCVNGRFNEHLDGFDTVLEDGDRVALIKPFMFCC